MPSNSDVDRLVILNWIDQLLREADARLSEASGSGAGVFGGEGGQRGRLNVTPSDEWAGVLVDLTGVVRDNATWLQDIRGADVPMPFGPADLSAAASPPTADIAVTGQEAVLPVWEPPVPDTTRLPDILRDNGSARAGTGSPGGREGRSSRRGRGSASSEPCFLDWPWSDRVGNNIFYWVVGPPASILCVCLVLGIFGSMRRE